MYFVWHIVNGRPSPVFPPASLLFTYMHEHISGMALRFEIKLYTLTMKANHP